MCRRIYTKDCFSNIFGLFSTIIKLDSLKKIVFKINNYFNINRETINRRRQYYYLQLKKNAFKKARQRGVAAQIST